MKSVLHIGIEASMYSSIGIKRGFIENGFEYYFMDWQRIKFNEGQEGLHSRMIMKASMEKPDLIFLHLQNADALDTETASRLSEIATVINFTEDVREDISWYEEIAPYIALTIFTNQFDVQLLKSKGIDNVSYMPTSYNIEWYKKQQPTDRYYGDIVFLGNNYANTNMNFPQAKERVEMVEVLKKEFGDYFRCYGQGWEDMGVLNPQQAVEAYNNAKIVVTHNNFIRAGYTSDRLFNAMGCGAAVVSHYFPGINQHFNATHLRTWLNFDMLIEEVGGLLKHKAVRRTMASLGHEHVLQNHTWASRIQTMLNLMEKHGKRFETV